MDIFNLVLALPDATTKVLLCGAALFTAHLLLSSIYSVYFGPLSKFPGPKMHAFSKIPEILSLMRGRDNDMLPALHAKYGPAVRVGPNELSFASGAQAWEDIYGFKKSGQVKPVKDPFFYGKSFSKYDSIISADDKNGLFIVPLPPSTFCQLLTVDSKCKERSDQSTADHLSRKHARQRKILSHALSDRALKDQEPMLKQWVSKLVSKLSERLGSPLDLVRFYNCTTFDVMGDLTFGENLNMLDNGEYSEWVKSIFAGAKMGTIVRGVMKLHPMVKWFIENVVFNNDTMRKKAKEHWDYSGQRVERRLKRNPERPDLWTRIISKSDGPDGLSFDEHQSTASLFMIAGTETTATALGGATYYLLRNPQMMKKLTDEIRNAYSSFEDIHLDGLGHLKYLKAVLQEACRLYPPVPIALPRVTPKDGTVICGQYVPGGVTVGAHHLATYRLNFTKPDEFHPERWLGGPAFADDKLDSFEPFSYGPRNCIGKNLAWHEMRLILASVLLHFDLELCEESLGWTDQRVYTLWEKIPLMCVLKPAHKSE